MRTLLSLALLAFLGTCVRAQATLTASVGLAEGYCTDPGDPNDCLNVPDGMDFLTYLPGQDDDIVVTYRIVNGSRAKITNFTIIDDQFGTVMPSSPITVGPGEVFVVTRRYPGFTTPQNYSIDVFATVQDDAGDSKDLEGNYKIEVVAPKANVVAELYRAREACDNSTDLGSCGGSGGPISITVSAGDSLYIRFPTTNTGLNILTNHVWTDSESGQITTTSFNLNPGQRIIAQVLRRAPFSPGTYNYEMTYTAEDPAGNSLNLVARYTITVVGPSGTLSVELYRAREACANPTDLGTCAGTDGFNTITVSAGDSLYIRYPIRNTGLGFLTNHVWTDSEYGEITTTGFDLNPNQAIIAQSLQKAPDLPGTYTFSATWTSEDEGGNVLSVTENYRIVVVGPSGTLSVELYRAREACANPTDLGTCAGTDGFNTITVSAGDSLYIRYPIRNTGLGFLTDHVWTDSEYGEITTTGFDLNPDQAIIAQSLQKAPSTIGTHTITATWRSEDEGGNELIVNVTYNIIVVAPASTFAVELYIAADECTDPTDLSTCGTANGGSNQITTGAGENIYVEYPVENTGLGPLTNHTWTTDLFGDVTTTSFSSDPGQELIARAIHTAPAAPGTYDVTATYTAEDEGGNLITKVRMYTIKVLCSEGDFAPPVARCRNRTFTIMEGETLSLNASMFNNGSSDGCGSLAEGFLDINSLDCDDAGSTTVTLRVEDKARNQASCTARVTLNVEDAIFRGERNECVTIRTPLSPGQTLNQIRTNEEQLVAGLIIGANFNLFEVEATVYRSGRATEGSGALEHLSKRITFTFYNASGDEVQPTQEAVYVRLYYSEEELATLGGNPNNFSVIKTSDDDCGAGYSARNAEAMNLIGIKNYGCQQTDRFYEFFAGGFSTFYLFRSDISLPVEFQEFTARLAPKERVSLDWKTATESGNSHFIVERSGDGGRFNALGEVAGAGTTREVQYYSFVDEAPLAGSNFYRLRQVDFDGTESFSEVRVVRVDFAESVDIQSYPNPAVHELYLKGFAGGQTVILDQRGRRLREETLAAGQPLDVRDLTPGIYLLRVATPAGTQTIKWIKQ